MAREHANVRLDMWGDRDWRSLSPLAQWLYMVLLTHPKTNRAGVSDWRPGRLAQLAAGNTAGSIRQIAAELEAKHFIVIDEETEEVLVRSFVKYDGVLKQPNMSVTMLNDWTGVASTRLQGIVAFEVQKIRARFPEWPVWGNHKLDTLLSYQGINAKSDPSVDPSVDPKPNPSVRGASTTTSTSTTTEASLPGGEAKLKETRIPKDWAPTKSHLDYARDNRIDVAAEAEAFRLHAETHDRHAARWNAAFTTWLRKAKPGTAATPQPSKKRFQVGVYENED